VYAFIYAPPGPLSEPYVVLSAYVTDPEMAVTEIRGLVYKYEFICQGATCAIPVNTASAIWFRAYTNSGDFSTAVNAVIRIEQGPDGYHVRIENLSPITLFTDSCAEIWRVSNPSPGAWMGLPQSPNQLSTDKTLHYLAGQMIRTGVVDASTCPEGGLSQDAPNGCGIQIVQTEMIDWQNQFDFDLWLAGRDLGISPYLLKPLIEQETQFWPASSRFYTDEYGLSQINELGADVLLRWDLDFYKALCGSVISDCSKSYFRQSQGLQAMLRGATTSLVNADCLNCSAGVDVSKAQSSVQVIARVVRANCADVGYSLSSKGKTASYDDRWRYTLAAYHSGIGCLNDALSLLTPTTTEASWDQVAPLLQCPGAWQYVDTVWNLMNTFNQNLLQPTVTAATVLAPTPLPTSTPFATPTLPVSSALVRVHAFVDSNQNGVLDAGEGVSGVPVQLNLGDGRQLASQTTRGEALFDMSGYPVGLDINVVLPGLYRTYFFNLPQAGEVLVSFPFSEPPIPGILP
jgi:hypothetical protein